MKNALLTLVALCFIVVNRAQGVKQVLTAPFADPGINLQQGVLYHPDVGGGPHLGGGIDYVKGAINDGNNWLPFEVLAAHGGTAVYTEGSTGNGNYVAITLDQPGSEPDYQTIYAHLEWSPLPVGTQVVVNQGDFIGITGITGNANGKNHLHFVFKVNGTPVDPYDVNNNRDYYPENGGSCGDDVYWVNCPPLRVAPTLINARKSTALNNPNTYGWSQSPATVFGNYSQLDWWFCFNPDYLYHEDGTSYNCYLARLTTLNPSYDAGLVYDVLGGARQAFCVGWEKWDLWLPLNYIGNDPTPTCGGNPVTAGGPHSRLGMPITNSYETESGSDSWRQDFQKGYIIDGVIYGYGVVNNFNAYAPGWTDDGWNRSWSYAITDCYDRHGASTGMGYALQPVNINWKSTAYHTQRYDFGQYGQGMIVYDPQSWIDDAGGDNKAYFIYGGFYEAYSFASYDGSDIPWYIGAPVADRSGDVQQFKYGYMEDDEGVVRVYKDGAGEIWSSEVWAAGGSYSDDYADLAVLYDYHDSHSAIHMLLSSGDNLNYVGNEGWWESYSYNPEAVVGTAGGDFDGDGLSDIANVYWYGGTSTRIHVFTSDGTSLTLENGSNGWWSSTGYNGSCVVGTAAGDFNGDGKDDLALMYWYGGTTTRIHIFTSTGSSFTYAGDYGWWASTGYNGGSIVGFAAGYFNSDDKCDLAAMYHYGGTTTRIHVFLSTGSALTYQGDYGWWASTSYNGSVVKSFTCADFSGNGKDDLAVIYHYGGTVTNIHMFLSSGSAFTLSNGADGWWQGTDYDGSQVVGTAAGMVSDDGRPDLVVAYSYGIEYTRFHVFRSTGTALVLDNGDDGWWGSTSYAPGSITGMACGYFNPQSGAAKLADRGDEAVLPVSMLLHQNYPNPFNPVTTISYSLREATHVSLEIFNILGQRVAQLVNEHQLAGEHTVTWDAHQYASGIYFYRLQTEAAVETKKMLLLK